MTGITRQRMRRLLHAAERSVYVELNEKVLKRLLPRLKLILTLEERQELIEVWANQRRDPLVHLSATTKEKIMTDPVAGPLMESAVRLWEKLDVIGLMEEEKLL